MEQQRDPTKRRESESTVVNGVRAKVRRRKEGAEGQRRRRRKEDAKSLERKLACGFYLIHRAERLNEWPVVGNIFTTICNEVLDTMFIQDWDMPGEKR